MTHYLEKEHRCIAAKCKGVLANPPESYGRYAYWRRGKWTAKPEGCRNAGRIQWGWFATPSKAQAKLAKAKKNKWRGS